MEPLRATSDVVTWHIAQATQPSNSPAAIACSSLLLLESLSFTSSPPNGNSARHRAHELDLGQHADREPSASGMVGVSTRPPACDPPLEAGARARTLPVLQS